MRPGVLLRLEDGALRRVDDEEFRQLAGMADYVLLGEGHTVACDHEVQARLLELLAGGERDWAVGLEMLGADKQSLLDAVSRNARQLAGAPERLAQELEWEANWGYPFELYAPVFETALRHEMPLYALNIPRGLLKELRRTGLEGLSPERRRWLPEEVIEPMEAQKASLRQVFSMHQEFMSGESKDPDKLEQRLERFFLVQSIWDTAMALRAHELRQELGGPVALIVGSGHVENGWGIEHRLTTMEPGARVLLVTPWRGGALPGERHGDVHYYCPESVTTKQGLTLAWIPNERGGHALVEAVAADSAAGRADLRPGDKILEAGGRELGSLGGLHLAAVTAKRKGHNLDLLIERNGYRLHFRLPIQDEQD